MMQIGVLQGREGRGDCRKKPASVLAGPTYNSERHPLAPPPPHLRLCVWKGSGVGGRLISTETVRLIHPTIPGLVRTTDACVLATRPKGRMVHPGKLLIYIHLLLLEGSPVASQQG